MLANRLSWFYDFSGPSMTVDTACSGGLVALHLACQELLAGSVDMVSQFFVSSAMSPPGAYIDVRSLTLHIPMSM